MARGVERYEASTDEGRWGERKISHTPTYRPESSKNLTSQFLSLNRVDPLALPPVFRYFPPAVAKVYVVTVRAIFIHSFLLIFSILVESVMLVFSKRRFSSSRLAISLSSKENRSSKSVYP
jgi:hypothetical protein